MTKAIVAVALAALVLAAVANAAPNTKEQKRRAAPAQPQIACTVLGCVPVPPGCGQTGGRDWGGNPNGLDVLVCPPGVQPFK